MSASPSGAGAGAGAGSDAAAAPPAAPVVVPPRDMPAAYVPKPGAPRLTIVKMVLENFKSYGGVREIGPFHKCFSAIVGPNGSGKSNVIDALLFVFGKRAKQLRLKKVSELIHRSKALPDLGYAKVSVHFQNVVDTDDSDDGYTVVPGSELVVTRMAMKNNSSKYYLDGRGSTFTEVTTLLRKRGVDLDNNRFLILQGEVEQIAMMKPKAATPHEEGLLEYLEDIIGSNRFVEAIEAAAQVLEGLCDERASVLNRVRLAEKDKEQLEGGKMEAEAYMGKERDIAQRQGVLAQHAGFRARRALDAATAKVETHEKEVAAIRAQVGETAEAVTAVEEKYAAVRADAEMVQQEQAKCKKAFTAFERKDIKLREDLKHQRTLVGKLKKAVKREAGKAEKAENAMEDAKAALPGLEAAVERAEAHKAEMEAKVDEVLESVKGEAEEFRVAMEAKQQELGPWSAKLNNAKAAYDAAATEFQLKRDQLEATAREREEAAAALEKARSTLKSRTAQAATLQREYDAKSGRLEEISGDLTSATARRDELTARVKALRAKTAEGTMAFQAQNSRGKMLATLMAATKAGGKLADAGLYGRLGDLGTIDAKYDVAISTACGALNHLVVQTVSGAQACVRFLRDNKLGVATFLILDEVKRKLAAYMARPVKVPSGTSRLFDLVQMNHDRFAPAFYYGLRNTLVARDLEQATAVAFRGDKCMWRVVTMNGELIDTAGTMSGGGKTVRRGGMKAAAGLTREEMAAAEEELKAAQRELLEARNLCSLMTSEKRGLDRTVPQLKVRIRKLSLEVASLTARAAELEARLGELDARPGVSDEDRAALAGLEEAAGTCKSAFLKVKVTTDALEAEVAELQKRIMNVGGKRLKAQKAKADASITKLEAATKAVTKARVDIKSGGKNKVKAENAAAKATKELATAEAKFEKLQAQFKQIQDEAFKMMTAYKEAETVCKAKQGELREVKKEFERLQAVASKAQKAELDVAQALEDAQRAVKGARASVEKSAQQLARVEAVYQSFLPVLEDEVQPAAAATATKSVEGEAEAEAGAGELETKGDDGDDGDDGDVDVEADSEADEASAKTGPAMPRTLRRLSDDELATVEVDAIRRDIAVLEAERDELKSNVNMGAIAEFRRKEKEWLSRVAELDAVSEKRDKCRRGFEKLRKQRLDEFMAGFSIITRKLKEMYQMITLGGDAELELVERLDPFSEGIVFSVRPPGKSWKNIRNLSGGEKTLSSLALVFALHHYRPTPLYVMDEIDAALDFKNVSIIAHYIKERTKNAQFVIISLRNNMFEVADRLVGIYKTNDMTKSVTINPKTFGQTPAASRASASAKAAAAKGKPSRRSAPSEDALMDKTNVAEA